MGTDFILQTLGLGCAGFAVLFMALIILVIFVAEFGALLPVALAMAFVPAVVYLSIILLIDRNDPEPPWMLALAFGWGAIISVFGALLVNDTTAFVATALAGREAGEFVGAVIAAPISEEGMKGLGLLIVNAMQNFQITLLWGAVLLAALTSLILYALMTALERGA